MSVVKPFVRHMLLCEDAQPNSNDSQKLNIYGLLSKIHSTLDEPNYPITHSFAVYVALTECRNSGDVRIVVRDAEDDSIIYVGHAHPIEFDLNPLKVHGVIIRVSSCSFPKPGLYWVQLLYNEEMISQQPLQVGEVDE